MKAIYKLTIVFVAIMIAGVAFGREMQISGKEEMGAAIPSKSAKEEELIQLRNQIQAGSKAKSEDTNIEVRMKEEGKGSLGGGGQFEGIDDGQQNQDKTKKEDNEGRKKITPEERKKALEKDVEKIRKEKLDIRRNFVTTRLTLGIKIIAEKQMRVETMLGKMEKRGLDISTANEYLNQSKSSLSGAQAAIKQMNEFAVDSEKNAEEIKRSARTAELAIKSSRDFLVQSVGTIQALVNGPGGKGNKEEKPVGDALGQPKNEETETDAGAEATIKK